MKLGRVTKLNKRNTATSKIIDDNVLSTICNVIVIFLIYDQSGSRTADVWSVKLTFSLTVAFYLRKTENRTKKPLTQLSYYCFD